MAPLEAIAKTDTKKTRLDKSFADYAIDHINFD